jgi:hypothetical protein
MSLQVNLSNKDIKEAYLDVVNAQGIDWTIFTYEKGTNDLKVQASGNGGLEELEEEFSDGRSVVLINYHLINGLLRLHYWVKLEFNMPLPE